MYDDMYMYSTLVRTVHIVHSTYICVCMSVCAYMRVNGEQTCTHCTCQPCTQRKHVAYIAVLLLFLFLHDNVILLIAVVITTYVPFFCIALGDISQEGLMSTEEIQVIAKKWEKVALYACISPINGEQTCTHCTCQPCTRRKHVAYIAVLFLLLNSLLDNVILLIVVVITT